MNPNTRVRELRKYLNLNQSDFGSKIGLKQATVGQIETGVRNLTDRNFSLICEKYNVNEKWLRHGIGDIFIENDNTIISELSNKYNLDNLDVKILESYLKLSGEQRKAIKKYVYSLVDTILEDDELYQDYRSEYIEENAKQSAARNGNTKNIEEAINLYDNLDDTLER
ncbi:XRE family transcriptional regulator [Clostridioides difficile]|uniref:helix-turn-helix domain-containing protein n=1 Tax=Clostridioides difficile TaxID=1496 RepID=UPI00093E381A|nr:helix-turn-helix transcriptional regulator [Clostridioides difficile]EGT4823062.1 XRE family transcriptional regulator [Clostridioides difficile]EGT5245303.1 XRE family transcriptional regulator [Clostridioides difficile]EII6832791.1 helix-turn-helix transcriptional regulator [Clostridioides difficile]EJA6610259.1 helix-turn-helix transcriptional regulator [Clostridioides difficile]EKS6798215.1 helix-turn-helix transcriptional regulator [Clostridioides difficile]